MKKIIILMLSFFCFINVRAIDFDIKSSQAILYNLTEDRIVYEKNPNDSIRIASLTKLMTIYTAIEYIEDLDAKVTLYPNVFYGLVEANASVAGFQNNEVVTYKDLLYGAMLPSGADATKAIGINLFGSEDKFIEKMNEVAKNIGMEKTVFTNTTGLDMEGQMSTVNDLLLLLKKALKDEIFKEIFTTTSYVTSNGRLTLNSTWKKSIDKFKIDVPIIGGKTGFTYGAGLCLASMTEEEGNVFILITTNVPVMTSTDPLHIKDAKIVYDKLFTEYNTKVILSKDDIIKTIPVRYSNVENYDIKIKDDVSLYLSEENVVTYRYVGVEELDSGSKKDEKIGTYEIYVDEILRDTIDIRLDQEIKFSPISFIKINWHIMLGSLFFVTSFIVIVRKRRT